MTRIRTFKPELLRHPGLYDLEKTHHLPLRLAFLGLFACCDREGRFVWESRVLKLDILPHDHDVNMEGVLDALYQGGFIEKYAHQGKWYGCIPTWKKHQRVNSREAPSVLPPPPSLGPHITDSSLSGLLQDRTTAPSAPENLGSNLLTQKQEKLEEEAAAVLLFLNEKVQKNFRPVKENLALIRERLASGVTAGQCKKIIARKHREWKDDPKMAGFLRPCTLFEAKKFEQYLGELVLPPEEYKKEMAE